MEILFVRLYASFIKFQGLCLSVADTARTFTPSVKTYSILVRDTYVVKFVLNEVTIVDMYTHMIRPGTEKLCIASDIRSGIASDGLLVD